MINYSYRRQFLISATDCSALNDWKKEIIGRYIIYVHPDTALTISKKDSTGDIEIALIGFILNPHYPNESNADILNDIVKNTSIESISEKLYKYTGRFVLMVKNNNAYFIFHDACGLRSVFYTKFNNKIFVASQALLFKLVMPLQQEERYHMYNKSEHKKSENEHWLPSGCSLYENVYHLVPNHYFNFQDLEQKRYWPIHKLPGISLEEGAEKASELLKKTLIACHARFKLALPLTGGWDSRALLSACKEIADDIYFFTLKYRDLTDDSDDIKISAKVLLRLGYTHNVIDCRKPIDKTFAEIYTSNSDMSHLNDWGNIAYGMMNDYPSDKVTIKGNCSEIARCAYYPKGTHASIISVNQLLKLVPGWGKIPFVKEQMSKWFSDIRKVHMNYGYDIMDMFYWEQRMGSWQAQSQLEWDIIQESVTPFNNRELLDILLSVDVKYRPEREGLLIKTIMQKLWKEVLVEPVNPRPFYHKFKIAYQVIKNKVVIGLMTYFGYADLSYNILVCY